MRYRFATAAFVTMAAVACMTSAAASRAASSTGIDTRLERLQAQVTAAEDIQAIKNLQAAYGYYVGSGMWADLADLFTQDAVANYPAGVFIGYKSIREHLFLNVGGKKKLGELGLGYGRLYDHVSTEPVIHLDPGGRTARGRWHAIAMFGSYGGFAVWAEGVYEMQYRKVHGVWKISKLDYYDGFGAPYATGWAAPPPRKPAAGGSMAQVRRVFRHLAHPPDRPRNHSCDGFPKACIPPFDYTNPGTTASGANAWSISPRDVAAVEAIRRNEHASAAARAADLLHRAVLVRDAQQIVNLQRIYGYYLDRAMWDQVADLFADDGTIEMGQRGVYVGKHRIREFLNLLGHDGLTYGWLNDHIQMQPVVDVAPDGKTAWLRGFELDMTGVYHKWAKWSAGIYENTYVKQDGVWKFKSLHYYPTFISDYSKGWAKDAEPAPGQSTTLPPDRPPTEVYSIYPNAFVPPYHYRNPVTGRPQQYPKVGGPTRAAIAATVEPAHLSFHPAPARNVDGALDAAERTVERAKDYDELSNLESAYGYYLDKFLWRDLADLFAKNGTMELAQRGVYEGRDHIFKFLLDGLGRGRSGPRPNFLGNHLQLQPVITLGPHGRTAKIRSRVLQQMAFGTRASIGAGVYENEAVKVHGIWKLSKDHVYNTLGANYVGGWAWAAGSSVPGESKQVPPDAPPTAKIAMFPVVYNIPFHYANPVTGRRSKPTPWQDGKTDTVSTARTPDPPPGMPAKIAEALQEMGPTIAPRTAALYTPLFPKEPYPHVSVTWNLHYGPAASNTLNIFTAPDRGHGHPVVVFVHGGGFSFGSAHMAGTPFYDNVGLWAAAHGLVGVTMNYRLAPKFKFPAGIEDLTAAVDWLTHHVRAYGGDPRAIFLWGHSSGAADVADYVAHRANAGERPIIAGAILTSGVSYDLGHKVSIWKAYYGSDVSKYPERSSLPGLLKTATPLLVTDAELDPPLMRQQTEELVKARAAAGKPVRTAYAPNHSHLSELFAVGTADHSLSGPVLEFVRQISERSARN
jgi:acetyl esterase/lipase